MTQKTTMTEDQQLDKEETQDNINEHLELIEE